MASNIPGLDFFTSIIEVHFDSGFLLAIRAFTVTDVAILDSVTATFQDHDIGRVINGLEEIGAHGVPPGNVRIVEPPTPEVENAYTKWRSATTIAIQNPGESTSTYTAESISYFHMGNDILVEKIDVTGLGPLGVTNVMGVDARLSAPDGTIIASASEGSANCPNVCTFTVTANSKLGTLTVTRFPDPA